MSTTNVERKSEMRWLSYGGQVAYRRGYECPEADYLWFPDPGISSPNHFDTRGQAVAHARGVIQKQIADLEQKRAALARVEFVDVTDRR